MILSELHSVIYYWNWSIRSTSRSITSCTYLRVFKVYQVCTICRLLYSLHGCVSSNLQGRHYSLPIDKIRKTKRNCKQELSII